MTLQRVSSSVLVLAIILATATPAATQAHREGLTRPLSIAAGPYKDRGDGVLWEGTVENPKSFWMRLHFSGIRSQSNRDFTVVIRDDDRKAVARYKAGQFTRSSELWSDVIFSDRVHVQVEGEPDDLAFTIDKFVFQLDPVGRLSPQTTIPNWRTVPESVSQLRLPRLAEASRAVAKLYIGDGYVCSGFLVTADIVLTNHHCLARSEAFTTTRGQPLDKRACNDIEAHFDFDQQGSPKKALKTNCLAVLDFDSDLDFALLRIDSRPIVSVETPVVRQPLRLSSNRFTSGRDVIVIHHPAGLAKKVSFQCRATDGRVDPERLIEHDCSTVGGSSGSPILNADMEVVGVHFRGAIPDDMTFAELQARLMAGEVFLNGAKPLTEIRARLQPFTK